MSEQLDLDFLNPVPDPGALDATLDDLAGTAGPLARPLVGPDPTLGQVAACIEGLGGLSVVRRRNLLSSLRTIAGLLRRAPEQLPADAAYLRRELARIHPAAVGMSTKRYANIRAEVLAALRVVGILPPLRAGTARLSRSWRRLHDACPQQHLQWKLSRFMRWCSANAIAPEAVDAATLQRFVAELESASLVRLPDKIGYETAYAWDACVQAVPSWPQRRFALPRKPGLSWTLPLDRFSASFQDDVEVYLARRAGAEPLDEDSPDRPLRPLSLHTRRMQIRTAASALVLAGTPVEAITSLADLLRPAAFRAILKQLRTRHGNKTTLGVYQLATALMPVARYHAKLTEAELDQLGALTRQVRVRNRRGLTPKNRDRLRPFDDPSVCDRLLTLPQELMRRADDAGRHPREAALDAQRAVALEILLMAPLRMRNLVGLRLGVHVLFSGTGPDEQVVLVIPEEEVKNSVALEFPLPSESARLIRRYVDRFLPRLATAPDDFLFPARFGGLRRRPDTLGKQITRAIREATGCTVNPHLMRHLGAKIFLEAHPGAYESARRVFGHLSVDTTTSFYTGFETLAAARQFDANVIRRRRQAEGNLGLLARGRRR